MFSTFKPPGFLCAAAGGWKLGDTRIIFKPAFPLLDRARRNLVDSNQQPSVLSCALPCSTFITRADGKSQV